MKKQRTPIPRDISAEILFKFRNTCCVCRNSDKAIQIHHMDEDPSNNDKLNLIVLCIECHNKTLIHGGFGRRMNDEVLSRYRDDWLRMLEESSSKIIDKIVTNSSEANKIIDSKYQETHPFENQRPRPHAFIKQLPIMRKNLLINLKSKMQDGTTYSMAEAYKEYIDSMLEILIILSKHFADDCFEGLSPEAFIYKQFMARQKWCRGLCEPDGLGTGGTITAIGSGVFLMRHSEGMIADMVSSLHGLASYSELKIWLSEWSEEVP